MSAAEGLVVLYADQELVAVDKPAGLHTAPLRRGDGSSLLERVIARYPEVAGLPGLKAAEPGLLHRLDLETSGVVLVARTAAAFRVLLAQFRAGQVGKEYLALCAPQAPLTPPTAAGGLRPGQAFAVVSRFAPSGPGRRKVRVVPPGAPEARAGRGRARRKAAPGLYRTEAEVLELRGGLALVRAALVRGFRHQVRAHLSHLGLPIVGDPLYGGPAAPGLPRLGLHAAAICFRHPADGRRMRIEAPCPPGFQVPGEEGPARS